MSRTITDADAARYIRETWGEVFDGFAYITRDVEMTRPQQLNREALEDGVARIRKPPHRSEP